MALGQALAHREGEEVLLKDSVPVREREVEGVTLGHCVVLPDLQEEGLALMH